MGARNALAAYRRWAGRVPATAMQVLTYMALVSKDDDVWPWYGQGHEALAEFALGRPSPDAADLRAVRRATTPLIEAGAITVDRAGAGWSDGNVKVRYRLNLHDAADAARASWQQSEDGLRRASDERVRGRQPAVDGGEHRTKNGRSIGRKVAEHRTKSGQAWDGNRPPEEEEEKEEREDQGGRGSETTSSHPPRATNETTNIINFSYRGHSRAAQAIAEATARRRAAEAAHRDATSPAPGLAT